VIELKLFDLPPIEIPGKEESPILPAGEVSAEEEFIPVKDITPELNTVSTEDLVIPVGEADVPMEKVSVQAEESTILSAPIDSKFAAPLPVPDSLPVSPANIAPGTSSPDTTAKTPAITVIAPPAITVSKAVPPPFPDPPEEGPPDTLSVNSADIATGTRSPDKPAKSKRGRKSLKQATAEADLIEVPGDDILFSKQYYTMRAVAEMFRVNQSLLRFWETEFDILQPRKNKKGDRYFRPIDIKNLHLIYHLLRQRKYTIEGAKEFLKKNKKAEERFETIQKLQEIRAFLLEWKAQL
jgi:DNA-binding transcriptional MerR regulator